MAAVAWGLKCQWDWVKDDHWGGSKSQLQMCGIQEYRAGEKKQEERVQKWKHS